MSMLRPLLIMAVCFFILTNTFAQSVDSVTRFVNSWGREVSTKDSADYILNVSPLDTTQKNKKFLVEVFYKNGKLRLKGTSTRPYPYLTFTGTVVTYFQNGFKYKEENFNYQGDLSGISIYYFPNGKVYNRINSKVESYRHTIPEYIDCRDSTGQPTTVNGKGNWIIYDDAFKSVIGGGRIRNGKKQVNG